MKKPNLMIIDIQSNFLIKWLEWWIIHILNYLNKNQKELKDKYNKIIQVIDNINELYEEDPYLRNFRIKSIEPIEWYLTFENWIMIEEDELYNNEFDNDDEFISYMENDYYTSIIDKLIYKHYGFLRDYMDYIRKSENEEYLKELLIKMIWIMYKYQIEYSSDLTIDFINWLKEFTEDEKNDLIEIFFDLQDDSWYTPYNFSLPFNLINEIEKTLPKDEKLILIWGWYYECLGEMYLLLKWIWYNVIIDENLVYWM